MTADGALAFFLIITVGLPLVLTALRRILQ
jgi:hypothetical protein